ncbi:MAG: YqaA family protein [Pseudomonadaceae bacterium]
MWELSGYIGLFFAALGAATLLPLQSEVVLVAMLLSGDYNLQLILLVATAGNLLGAIINWWLGRYIEHFQQRRWFPLTPERLHRTQQAYHRWGFWSLLLSWAPFIGDPLTIVAGVMREPLWRFTLIVLVAKGGRYLILTAITLGWLAD